MLVYATGGLAYGGVKSSSDIWQNNLFDGVPRQCGVRLLRQLFQLRTGWVVGGGVEWMFLPNWSLKAEYLHYDLGRATYGMGKLAFSPGPALRDLPLPRRASTATSSAPASTIISASPRRRRSSPNTEDLDSTFKRGSKSR